MGNEERTAKALEVLNTEFGWYLEDWGGPVSEEEFDKLLQEYQYGLDCVLGSCWIASCDTVDLMMDSIIDMRGLRDRWLKVMFPQEKGLSS